MPHPTDLPDTDELPQGALHDALNSSVAGSLRPVALGLALFYALLSIWYVAQFEGPARNTLATSSALFSLALLAGATWFQRNRLPARFGHPVAAAVGLAVITNCLLPIVASGEPRQTTHLMVAQLGFGCLFLSVRWFVAEAAVAMAGWALVAGARADDPDWYHFGLALVESTLFAALILIVRIRAYRNIQALRLRDGVLVRQLTAANEEALVAVRAKSAFLANMSHEIRTPMTAMLGMTELLQMSDLDDAQRSYADTVARSGNNLLQLVNDILDFSKIEAGQLVIEQVPFCVGDVLDEVRGMLDVKAKQKGLSLTLELDPEVPTRLRGDPTRMQQIVVNLVGNAIKFTEQGGVIIKCHAEGSNFDATILTIDVIDTGIGIESTHLDDIFEAFTQADSSTTRRFGGTGLGLAISSQLALLMGGRLNVSSEPGRGSTFSLTLPLASAPKASLRPEPASVASPAQSYGAHVLVVEDNLDNRDLAQELLARLGCEVELAEDGEAALALLDKDRGRFDLVFMDCQMPNMNGYEATQEIRLREREGEHLAIVALTASVLPEERARCQQAGMDDYVAKPFSQQDLERILVHWCPPTGR